MPIKNIGNIVTLQKNPREQLAEIKQNLNQTIEDLRVRKGFTINRKKYSNQKFSEILCLAQNNKTIAMITVAEIYEYGNNEVGADIDKAIHWYGKAFEMLSERKKPS